MTDGHDASALSAVKPLNLLRRRLNRHGFMYILVCIAVFAGLGSLVRAYSPYVPGIVLGESMTPALKPYQLFLIDRMSYRNMKPQKNDVVVFRHGGDTFIKRVTALPGDTMWIITETNSHRSSGVFGVIPFQGVPGRRRTEDNIGVQLVYISIPEGFVFVTGDNGEASTDSRDFGPISTDQIVGRICLPGIGPKFEDSHLLIRCAGDNWGCLRAARSARDKSKLLMSFSLQEAVASYPCTVGSISLDGTSRLASENELAICTVPGKYVLRMALTDRESAANSNLWSLRQEVTIEPGRNTVVRID